MPFCTFFRQVSHHIDWAIHFVLIYPHCSTVTRCSCYVPPPRLWLCPLAFPSAQMLADFSPSSTWFVMTTDRSALWSSLWVNVCSSAYLDMDKGWDVARFFFSAECGALLMQLNSVMQQVDFLPVNYQCRLSYSVYTVPVCMHALTSVCILKIPSTGCHTIIWTCENTAHTRSTLEDGIWLPMWQGNWNITRKMGVLPPWKRCRRRYGQH